jgi:hypothetical protein
MTHVKIIKCRVRSATQLSDCGGQKNRVTFRGGRDIGRSLPNVKATGLSLREGSRGCGPRDCDTRPEACVYGETVPGSYSGVTAAFSRHRTDYKRNGHPGIGSLPVQRAQPWANSQGKPEKLSWNIALTDCHRTRSAKRTNFLSLLKRGEPVLVEKRR